MISPRWCARRNFAKTFSTGSMCCVSSCRHCASEARTFYSWPNHFLRRASPESPKKLSAAAAEALLDHAWPGNVRELENLMRSLSLTVRGTVIDRDDLHFEGVPIASDTMDELLTLDLPAATARLEKMLLRKALRESG